MCLLTFALPALEGSLQCPASQGRELIRMCVTFQLVPRVPLGFALEVQEPRPICIYIAHSSLFEVTVDEQHLFISWLSLEALHLLSGFVREFTCKIKRLQMPKTWALIHGAS